MSNSACEVNLDMNVSNGTTKNNLDPNSASPDANTLFPAFTFRPGFMGYSDDDVDAAADDRDDSLKTAFGSFSVKPDKLDPEALAAIEDVLHTNILDGTEDIDFQHCCEQTRHEQLYLSRKGEKNDKAQKQFARPHSSDQTDSVEGGSPLQNTTPHLFDFMDSEVKYSLSSAPYSASSEKVRTTSPSGSQGQESNVYISIAAPPLCGRALDFRSFVSKKHVPTAVLKENSVGVFVGQLPSTYSEEDIAALLRGIGADSGVPVHVRDVKSHNQSRTCAFVVVNRSALSVLLGYSKRILCDVSCVWIVEWAQSTQLKDYINSFLRDRLRGVPKAALVLEELTPQYMRSRASSGKGGRSVNRQAGNNGGVNIENIFMAAHDSNTPMAPPSSLTMNLFMPGWNSQDPSVSPFGPVLNAQGVTSMLNANSGPSIPLGGLQANMLPPPQSMPIAPPTQQINYYAIGGNSNEFQALPHPTQVNGKVPCAPTACASSSGGGALGGGSGVPLSSSYFPDVSAQGSTAVPAVPTPTAGLPCCSMCLAPIGAMDPVYLFPYDNTVVCMRCSSQRIPSGDASLIARGMAPYVIPPPNLNGFQNTTTGGATMFLPTFPSFPFPSQTPSSNQFISQMARPSLPLFVPQQQ